MDKTNCNRIRWIDAARGLAMCMIVFGHAIPGGMVKQFFYSFHVPVFFFLSGLLFRGGREKSFWDFLKKEFRAVLVPYYLAALISIGIYQLFGKMAQASLHVSAKRGSIFLQLLGMLYGNCKTGYMKWNLPLWFLPCLFAVSLLGWAVDRLLILPSFKKEEKQRFLCFLAFIMVGTGIVLTDFCRIRLLPLGLETGIRMFPFFLLGMIFREEKEKLLEYGPGIKTVVLLVTFLICVYASSQNRLVLYHKDRYGKEGLFFLGAVSGIIFVIFLGKLLEGQTWLSYIGQHTLVILLFHKFPILFCQVIFSPIGKLLKRNQTFVGVMVSGISILCCLMLPVFKKKFLDKRKGL